MPKGKIAKTRSKVKTYHMEGMLHQNATFVVFAESENDAFQKVHDRAIEDIIEGDIVETEAFGVLSVDS